MSLQTADDADGLVAMERQHLLQLKKSMETEMALHYNNNNNNSYHY